MIIPKNSMLYNTIEKHGMIETIFLLLLLVMIFVLLYQKGRSIAQKKEGFTNNIEYVILRGNDVYNDFYIGLYDLFTINKNRHTLEIDEFSKLINNDTNANILDIGSGKGHHVEYIKKKCNNPNYSIEGVDLSPSMINKSKSLYPDNKYKIGDALDVAIQQPNQLTHISCFYFTIYYIENKPLFFRNCYKWLQPGGKVLIHLVNPDNFHPKINEEDYISNASFKYFMLENLDSDDNIYNYNHKKNYNYYKESNFAEFRETFKHKNTGKLVQTEQLLYMPPISDILDMAKSIGFIVLKKTDMSKCKYVNHYLYVLQKPT